VTPATDNKKSKYYWMPEAMPKVAAEVAKRRALHGTAFVNECIKRGMTGQPGYFFAVEGPLWVGTPDPALGSVHRLYDVVSAGLPVDWLIEMPTPESLTGDSNVKNT
jgi:hypothetical protein